MMKRRDFVKPVGIGCAAALGDSLYAQAKSNKPKRLNIIYIFALLFVVSSLNAYGIEPKWKRTNHVESTDAGYKVTGNDPWLLTERFTRMSTGVTAFP